jgi:hypothetical protein
MEDLPYDMVEEIIRNIYCLNELVKFRQIPLFKEHIDRLISYLIQNKYITILDENNFFSVKGYYKILASQMIRIRDVDIKDVREPIEKIKNCILFFTIPIQNINEVPIDLFQAKFLSFRVRDLSNIEKFSQYKLLIGNGNGFYKIYRIQFDNINFSVSSLMFKLNKKTVISAVIDNKLSMLNPTIHNIIDIMNNNVKLWNIF